MGLNGRGSRAARASLAFAVAATIMVVGIGQAPPSYAAPGSVTGSVFQDFDGDGTRDAGNTAAGVQTDNGFAGVTVTAYGPHNEVVGTAATAANGSYTINTTSVPDGTPLRIEFTDANGGTTAQLPGDLQSSFHGVNNGTSVRFAAAGATNVDFGVLEPEDFADNNAPIITAIQYAGLRTAAGSTDLPAVVVNPWVVPANDPTPPANTTYPGRVDLASYGAVGSVWGTAFNRRQNAAYAAATYKRVSDMGPLGLGGIYRIPNVVNQATGALNPSPGAVEQWLDVDALPGVDLGAISSSRPRARSAERPGARPRRLHQGRQGRHRGDRGQRGRLDAVLRQPLRQEPLRSQPPRRWQQADQRHPDPAQPRGRTSGPGPWRCTATGSTSATSTPVVTAPPPGSPATGNFYVVSQPVAAAVAGGTGWQADLTAPLSYTKGNNITGWGATIANGDAIPSNPPRQSAGPGHALELLDRQLVLGDQRVRRLQHRLWMDPHLPAGHPGQPRL